MFESHLNQTNMENQNMGSNNSNTDLNTSLNDDTRFNHKAMLDDIVNKFSIFYFKLKDGIQVFFVCVCLVWYK